MRCGCKLKQRPWPPLIAAQLRRNKKAEEEKRYSGAQYVEHVLQDSGLSMPLVLLTDGYGSESFKQVEEIVSFVRRSDRVRVRYASSRRLGSLNISTACISEATALCVIIPFLASCCLVSGLVWYSCSPVVTVAWLSPLADSHFCVLLPLSLLPTFILALRHRFSSSHSSFRPSPWHHLPPATIDTIDTAPRFVPPTSIGSLCRGCQTQPLVWTL